MRGVSWGTVRGANQIHEGALRGTILGKAGSIILVNVRLIEVVTDQVNQASGRGFARSVPGRGYGSKVLSNAERHCGGARGTDPCERTRRRAPRHDAGG